MVAELSRKLRQVFGFSENHIQAVLYDLRRVAEKMEIDGDLHIIADDPDDDKFVECALVAGASLIVSGDHHLLNLGEYKGIHVISAAEFVARFAKAEGDIAE
jgi:putative PIN family toxin of toxin-antitoxin system